MVAAQQVVPMEGVRAARDHRRRVRAQALIDLSEGRVSLQDVLLRATTPEGEELLKVPVRQLLLSIDGVGEATVREVIARMVEFTARAPLSYVTAKPVPRGADIRWLLDGRCHGARVVALAEAVACAAPIVRFDVPGGRRTTPSPKRPSAPWARFPFAPPPARMTARLGDRVRRTGEVLS